MSEFDFIGDILLLIIAYGLGRVDALVRNFSSSEKQAKGGGK